MVRPSSVTVPLPSVQQLPVSVESMVTETVRRLPGWGSVPFAWSDTALS